MIKAIIRISVDLPFINELNPTNRIRHMMIPYEIENPVNSSNPLTMRDIMNTDREAREIMTRLIMANTLGRYLSYAI